MFIQSHLNARHSWKTVRFLIGLSKPINGKSRRRVDASRDNGEVWRIVGEQILDAK
jgi:hypothetical protein